MGVGVGEWEKDEFSWNKLSLKCLCNIQLEILSRQISEACDQGRRSIFLSPF